MVTEKTEQETTQTLAEVISEPSTESEEVSEETEEQTEEETTEVEPLTPEVEARVKTEVQSRVDIQTNKYRETRETDTALLREQKQKIAELTKQARSRTDGQKLASILSSDEGEGLEEEKIQNRQTLLKEFIEREKGFLEKSAEVEESAEFIAGMAEKLPAYIVKDFGLNDPNPNIRAVNGAHFINETIALDKRNTAFQEVVGIVLTKGSEVRRQIESFTDELMELSDKKGRDLLLEKIKSGLKTTPKKAPPTPSEGVGGGGSSNKDFIGKYNKGELNSPADHKRAAEILDKLRRS